MCSTEQTEIEDRSQDQAESISMEEVQGEKERERVTLVRCFLEERKRQKGKRLSAQGIAAWAVSGLKSKPVEICEGLDLPTS